MNSFGNSIRLTLFGESHGAALGCTFDGLPAGFVPDLERVEFELTRRAPHSGVESTRRSETDRYSVLSGMLNGACTGAPLTVVFENRDARSADYCADIPRPSHADLAARLKYKGFNDHRGGGMFSGRMTLPLVFAGALCRQLLEAAGILIASHISSIGGIQDVRFDPCMKTLPQLDPHFPLVDPRLRAEIDALFSDLRRSGDSVGGSVECAALGVPAGIGEPFFNGLESCIAHILFSVPGVHGVEFGAGFGFSGMRGSEANDPISPDLTTLSNNSGGINGGISNGMPIVFRAAFRPVPSIALPQRTVDLSTSEAVTLEIKGRHDCCILPRACAAVEAAAAIALYDSLKHSEVIV